MDRKGVTKRGLILFLILGLAFFLSGCRTRTVVRPPEAASPAGSAGMEAEEKGERLADAAPSEDGEADGRENAEAGGRTKENPDAARKEYDENAPAEVSPGTDRLLHAEGEGGGAAAAADGGALTAVSRLNDEAGEAATQTVAAQEAEDMGVSEEAEQASSAITYFTVLLKDRTGSLFECQRANAYWETAEDHVTVHKSSAEHTLILSAGAYDVSARLLPENLKVDDGWVARKNPQVIVKIVDGGVLGGGVHSVGAARAALRRLCAREGWERIDAVKNRRVILLSEELLEAPHLQTAALLLIAQTAYPASFSDVDAEQALRMLSEEATGLRPTGIYWFSGGRE